jgi:hypothetical protein
VEKRGKAFEPSEPKLGSAKRAARDEVADYVGAARDEFQGKEAPPTLFPRFPFSLFVAGRASDRIRSLFFDILIFEQEHYGIEV